MLHSVLHQDDINRRIINNDSFEISSEFFESLIQYLLSGSYEFISLDELHERIRMKKKENTSGKKFICITFDDGYRDNYTIAYHILKKYNIPFAIYVITGFPDMLCVHSGAVIEDWVHSKDIINFSLKNNHYSFVCENKREKEKSIKNIGEILFNSLASTDYKKFFSENGVSYNDYVLDWNQINKMSGDEIVTIGSHTITHPDLTKLREEDAFYEINESKKRLEEVITKKVEHFAYPFGAVTDREFRLAKKAGFKTLATVLRWPICYRKTRSDALPRIGVVHNDFSFFANL